jgi:hypothetical protein
MRLKNTPAMAMVAAIAGPPVVMPKRRGCAMPGKQPSTAAMATAMLD